MCRNSTTVCKVKCNNTGKVHIENTQQNFTARMQQHFNEAQQLVKLGEKSDSHAKHFATQFHNANPSPANQRGGTTSASSDNATKSVQSKLLPPKTAPCVPKRELQFFNNPDPTHNFLSTPTTKWTAPADTDHDSTRM